VNGSAWPDFGYGYLDGEMPCQDPGAAGRSDARRGRHRGAWAGSPPRVTLWSYQEDQEEQADGQRPRGSAAGRSDLPPLGPQFPGSAPPGQRAARPPARPYDYRRAGDRSPALPASDPSPRYGDRTPAYGDRAPVSLPPLGYLPASRGQAVPAVPRRGEVTRPRERVRGMNAALETGIAGVGELAPARQPARPRQMVVAVLVAAAGLAAAVLTYKSLASGPVSFGGEVVPQHVYALSFGTTGAVTAVKVRAGQHVTAGEVLATQDAGLARANLQEAKDAAAAAAAALYADEHPQQSSIAREQDAVNSAQSSLDSETSRASGIESHDSMIVSERQQAVTADQAAYASQCGSSTASSACQSLAAKLATAKSELAQAQATAAADRQAAQQREQAAQSRLSESEAALQQVQAQAGGVSVTLDEARQRLAAAQVQLAQDEAALKGTTIVAPASGTVGAVSAAPGDSITGSNLHNPVVTIDSGPLVVSARLPGTEIGEVRAGQPVTLHIEPLRVNLPGSLVQVNQVASQSQTDVSYVVVCQIDARDAALMPGMTVTITPR
jgi:multidrug resistance efflux pump